MYNIEDILDKLEENTKNIENSYSQLQVTIADNNKKLEEQANTIQALKNTIVNKDETILQLQNTINSLQSSGGNCDDKETVDLGLLGDMTKIPWVSSQNGCTYEIKNENIVVSGVNRYSNISYTYNELAENYVDNVRTKYNLHIEGYVVKGCTNGYLCSTSNPIEKTFNKDISLLGTWKRTVVISIFLSQAIGEDSQLVITSLKLTLS